MAVAGLGTDTGGSARIPAALNGIVGFRPTVGRYPAAGLTRISSTRDTVGPMARSVADVALLDAVITGDDVPLPKSTCKNFAWVCRDTISSMPLSAGRCKRRGAAERVTRRGRGACGRRHSGHCRLNEAVSFPSYCLKPVSCCATTWAEFVPTQTLETLADSIASPDVKTIIGGVVNGDMPESAYLNAINVDRPRLRDAYANYFVCIAGRDRLSPRRSRPGR